MKFPTPEETRERLLAQLTKILEEHDKASRNPFGAPEARLRQTRSELYAMMCGEFNTFAAFNGDVLKKVYEALDLPPHASVDAMLVRLKDRVCPPITTARRGRS